MRYIVLFLALVLFLDKVFAQTCTSTLAQEYQALMALYQSTNGANWTNKTGWSTADPNVVQSVVGWHGITTNTDGRVINLSLGFNNLTGPIPMDIGSLCYLETLDLSSNHINSEIPSSITTLSRLTALLLGENNLSGSIPSAIGNLVNLKFLYFHENGLTGSIPGSFVQLSALQKVAFSLNHLTGQIPSTIDNLNELQELSLNNNQLTGAIPSTLCNLVNLKILALNNNFFQGGIPGEIGQLVNLNTLKLHVCNLSGIVPSSMINLSRLTRLYLSGNQLSGEVSSKLSATAPFNTIEIRNNKFIFSDFIVAKQARPTIAFTFNPQGLIDEEKIVQAQAGGTLTLTTSIDRNTSPASIYQWFKKVGAVITPLNTASSTGHTIVIPNMSAADAGTKYYYTITNAAAPGLTLKSHEQTFQLLVCNTPTIDFQSEELNGTHTFNPTFVGEGCTPTYSWDFGDGTTSTEQVATHAYTATGTFTVTLTVSYTCGPCPSGQITASHEVTIENGFCGSIYCDGEGGVGIGTRVTDGFRLSVNGKIRASDIIKVYPQNQWSDFVFEKDYKLRPLNEVEAFIKKNGHLPEIPSAKEVEIQGIDLGGMDAKLLQKIEELTLYVIELKKENEVLKKQVDTLSKRKK